MEVRKDTDGDIVVKLEQDEDSYYASTWQAGQSAAIILSLPPKTAKELLEKLKEVLNAKK